MVVDNEVERLKARALDMLDGSWRSFEYIYDGFRECGAHVDEDALRCAIDELIAEGKVEHDDQHGEDEYRCAPPQEGENIADKVKRLEVEVGQLRAHLGEERCRVEILRSDVLRKDEECLALAADAQYALEERDRIRAEQAADRAAVRALVEALPRCMWRGADGARCDRFATWSFYEDETCEEHRSDRSREEPWAAPLRALLERMNTWEEGK